MDNSNVQSILSELDFELCYMHPAVGSLSKLYLIQGDRVVGQMRMQSGMGLPNGMYDHVTVVPDDEETRDFFKDDFTMKTLNDVVGLRYDGITGYPRKNFIDEPDDRHKNTQIVDKLEFDFGICHPRHENVVGYGKGLKRSHLRVKTKQLHRRPRPSNKIKKVA